MTGNLVWTGVAFALIYFVIGVIFDKRIRGHSYRKAIKAKGLETLIATVVFVIVARLIG